MCWDLAQQVLVEKITLEMCDVSFYPQFFWLLVWASEAPVLIYSDYNTINKAIWPVSDVEQSQWIVFAPSTYFGQQSLSVQATSRVKTIILRKILHILCSVLCFINIIKFKKKHFFTCFSQVYCLSTSQSPRNRIVLTEISGPTHTDLVCCSIFS